MRSFRFNLRRDCLVPVVFRAARRLPLNCDLQIFLTVTMFRLFVRGYYIIL